MNFSKLNLGSLIIAAVLLISGCASSGSMNSNQDLDDLRSHLNRDRHVTFNGNRVFIKGTSFGTFQGNKLEPLFIINGVDAGRGFSNAVNVVSGRMIESVDVYRSSEAGRWGGRGAHGVVVVKTKTTSSSE